MFTPEYLSELVEATDMAATEFNIYLTNKIVDSVISLFESEGKIKIIPTNQYRIQLLKQSGILVSEIEKEIGKSFPGLDNQIREAFYQVGYEINDDINKSVSDMVDADEELKDFIGKAPRLENLTDEEKRILDSAYKRTNGELKNLTRTTASDMNVKFMNACDAAWWKAKHGISGSTAIKEAIDEVSQYGTCVVYKSGRKMSIEAAVRMCVLTGINQANSEITLRLCAETGMTNVLVSSHIGARYTDKIEPANHMSWQGKVYSLSDELLQKYGYNEKESKEEKKGSFSRVFEKIKEFFQKQKKQRNYDDFETVTGYGSIEGLSGINCRHTFQPFYPGMSNNQEQYDSEENKKAYDLSQKQRSMERKIRETKKRLFEMKHAVKTASNEELISKLTDEEAEIKEKFDKQNSAYTTFCKQNGLRRREDRLYIGNSKQIYKNKRDGLHKNNEKDWANNQIKMPLEEKTNILGTGSDNSGISKGKFIGKIDYERASEAVSYFNHQIKNDVVENAVIIDKDGSVFHFIGDTSNVNFEGIHLDKAYITHNHPESNGILSFGKNDFEFLKANQNIALLGCCNSQYEYFVKLLKDISNVSYNEIYLEGFKFSSLPDFETQDAAMRVLEERGYIKYDKRRIE